MALMFRSIPSAVNVGFVIGADMAAPERKPGDTVPVVKDLAGPRRSYGTECSTRSSPDIEDCRGRDFLRPKKESITESCR